MIIRKPKAKLGPYDIQLSRDLPHNRVTDFASPMTFLVPDDPVFNTPNKITAADFEGWVQERGLNLPSQWDTTHYISLLACSDPGEAPKLGQRKIDDDVGDVGRTPDIDRRVEVKCRGNGFRELYRWLEGADMLIVRADRRELLVVVPLKLAAEIAAAAEHRRPR